MSLDPSRKHFLAKCLGLLAVAGLTAKSHAKPRPQVRAAQRGVSSVVAPQVESRAVPRGESPL